MEQKGAKQHATKTFCYPPSNHEAHLIKLPNIFTPLEIASARLRLPSKRGGNPEKQGLNADSDFTMLLQGGGGSYS